MSENLITLRIGTSVCNQEDARAKLLAEELGSYFLDGATSEEVLMKVVANVATLLAAIESPDNHDQIEKRMGELYHNLYPKYEPTKKAEAAGTED